MLNLPRVLVFRRSHSVECNHLLQTSILSQPANRNENGIPPKTDLLHVLKSAIMDSAVSSQSLLLVAAAFRSQHHVTSIRWSVFDLCEQFADG